MDTPQTADKENSPQGQTRRRARTAGCPEGGASSGPAPTAGAPPAPALEGLSSFEQLGARAGIEALAALGNGLASRPPDAAAQALVQLGVMLPPAVAAAAAAALLARADVQASDVPSLRQEGTMFPSLPPGLDTRYDSRRVAQ